MFHPQRGTMPKSVKKPPAKLLQFTKDPFEDDPPIQKFIENPELQIRVPIMNWNNPPALIIDKWFCLNKETYEDELKEDGITPLNFKEGSKTISECKFDCEESIDPRYASDSQDKPDTSMTFILAEPVVRKKRRLSGNSSGIGSIGTNSRASQTSDITKKQDSDIEIIDIAPVSFSNIDAKNNSKQIRTQEHSTYSNSEWVSSDEDDQIVLKSCRSRPPTPINPRKRRMLENVDDFSDDREDMFEIDFKSSTNGLRNDLNDDTAVNEKDEVRKEKNPNQYVKAIVLKEGMSREKNFIKFGWKMVKIEKK